MAAKGGQEHHFAKRQRENKQDVLRLVAAGMDVKSAVRRRSRSHDGSEESGLPEIRWGELAGGVWYSVRGRGESHTNDGASAWPFLHS